MDIFTVSILFSNYLYALFFNLNLLALQITIICVYFLCSQIYSKRSKTSVRRKIAMASWDDPNEGKLLGEIPLNCEIIDEFISEFNLKNPETKISYTHFFAKVVGVAFGETQNFTGKIVFGEFVPAEKVDIGFTIDIGGKNLGLKRVENCDSRSLVEIKRVSSRDFRKVRNNTDKLFKKNMKVMNCLPSCLIALSLEMSGFISSYLEFENKKRKIMKDQVGSIIITNVSKMKFTVAYPPLTGFTQTMGIFAITEPKMRAVVDNENRVVARKMLNMNFDIDHRFCNWEMIDLMLNRFQKICQTPREFLL